MHARRRSRRPLILAAVVTAALTLGACASSGAPGDSDAGATGGELVWAIAGANLSAAHMDPQTSQLDSAASVQRGVLDSLVFQNADGTFSPWLASAWSISDDGLEYTFTLRDDVVFHDGTTFDADAVKANLDRIANPATASAQAASMLGADYYVGTEVVDPTTVIVSFTQPNAPFLQAASTAYLGMYSKATLDDNASKLKTGGPGITVGSGPLVMTGYVPDQEIVYERNADYAWGPNGATAPAFDTLRVAIVPEPAVRVGMLASGEAQLASDITPSGVSTLDTSIKVDAKSVPGLPYSLFLNEAYGVFGDPLVREAFSRAIDIDTAVETIYFGQYQRAWSILGPATPGYDKSLEGTWKFDPATANALLDQAGWTQRDSENYRVKNGERLSARWIAWTPIADDAAALANAMQADLREVGFEIVRETLEPGAYNEQYAPKTFDLTDWNFAGVDPDMLRAHLHTEGFQNASQVSDPALDTLLDDAVAESDPAARAAIYREVQQWNATHNAIVPLFVPSVITAVAPEVQGLTYDLYGRPLYFGVSLG